MSTWWTFKFYPSDGFARFFGAFFTALLIVSLPLALCCQNSDTLRLEKIWETNIAARSVYADHLGQVYVVTQKNELIKYDPEGLELFRYADKRYGKLHFVDVSNPMQLLLYYGDFNYVVILERTLTASGFLRFQELGFPMVSAVSSAVDGNIWLYDAFNARLVKADRRGRRLLESAEMPLLLGRRPELSRLIETGGRVYGVDETHNVLLIFDLMGQWLRERKLRLDGEGQLLTGGGEILYVEGKVIEVFSLNDPLFRVIQFFPATFPSFKHVAIRKERVAIVAEDGSLQVFKIL